MTAAARHADTQVVTNPHRPERAWADAIIDVRPTIATSPLPSALAATTHGAWPLLGTDTMQGWSITQHAAAYGAALTIESPHGQRACLVYDPDFYDSCARFPGLRRLLGHGQGATAPSAQAWHSVPVLHAALTVPDAWLACRDRALPEPGSDTERDALTEMVAWASAGVAALWQARRWTRYHVPTAYHLARHLNAESGDHDAIRARAPYRGVAHRSYDAEMAPREAAAWSKHVWCLPHAVVLPLHRAGVRPLDVVPYLHEMGRVGAWMGNRFGKSSPGRSDGCGPLGSIEYTAPALVALVTTPGLTAETAVAAARAGLSADEIRDAHTRGALDEDTVASLASLAAMRARSRP